MTWCFYLYFLLCTLIRRLLKTWIDWLDYFSLSYTPNAAIRKHSGLLDSHWITHPPTEKLGNSSFAPTTGPSVPHDHWDPTWVRVAKSTVSKDELWFMLFMCYDCQYHHPTGWKQSPSVGLLFFSFMDCLSKTFFLLPFLSSWDFFSLMHLTKVYGWTVKGSCPHMTLFLSAYVIQSPDTTCQRQLQPLVTHFFTVC